MKSVEKTQQIGSRDAYKVTVIRVASNSGKSSIADIGIRYSECLFPAKVHIAAEAAFEKRSLTTPTARSVLSRRPTFRPAKCCTIHECLLRRAAPQHYWVMANGSSGPFASSDTRERKPDLRCALHRRLLCGQSTLSLRLRVCPLLAVCTMLYSASFHWFHTLSQRTFRNGCQVLSV